MRSIRCTLGSVALALALALALASGAFAASAGDDEVSKRLEMLESKVKSQDAEIARLRAERGDDWLSEERTKEIRAIVEDVLADADTRSSLTADGATAGWDKGFFLASPDGNFKLSIGGQFVVRYAFSRLSTRSLKQLDPGTYQPPVTGPLNGGFPGGTEIRGYQGFSGENGDVQRTARGFEIRQMKIDFAGHVIDPSWQYKVTIDYQQTSAQTGFNTMVDSSAQASGVQSTGPTAGNASGGPGTGGGVAGLEDAFIRKVIDPNWSVRVGQFKAPLLREELVSDRNLLAADRSLVNQFFTAKRTQGVELTFQNDCVRVIASFNDGGNNSNTSAVIGGNAFNGTFTQYALTGRAEWKIAGDWSQFENLSSFNGENFAMYVGGGVNWQRGGEDNLDVSANSWTTGGATGTLMTQGGTVVNNGFTGTTALVPITALQYPNNIPLNGNDDVNNITYTFDSMIDFGGFSIFGAFVGNVAYNIPAGWVANPSGGFGSTPASPPGPANNVPGNWSAVTSGGVIGPGPGVGQPAAPAAVFVPGYGYGHSPIFSYGLVAQEGWFIIDDVELFGRYEWYDVVNNGQNAYAGNTASFWGFVPGGSSPFANNTNANGTTPGFPGPNTGIDSPTDGYIGGQTNPYYAYNFGANPYAAQHNSIITGGLNWYPMGVKNRAIKVTGDLSYSIGPVLFQNGIYGQSITGADFRNDGGQPGGGQWVGRFQIQLIF